MRQEKAYLSRYHCSKSLLMRHGYNLKQADDLVGLIAPQIADTAVRTEAREAMLARLAALLEDPTLIAPP